MNLWQLGLLFGPLLVLVGFWFVKEAKEIDKRIKLAELLTKDGIKSTKAISIVGLRHFELPFYKRIFMPLPKLPVIKQKRYKP